MAVQNLKNLRVGDAVEVAVSQHGAYRLAISSGPALERMDHGQRGLTFAQVARHRLAQYVFSGDKVENVIDNLKGEPKIAAVVAKLRLELFRIAEAMCRCNGCSKLHGNLE